MRWVTVVWYMMCRVVIHFYNRKIGTNSVIRKIILFANRVCLLNIHNPVFFAFSSSHYIILRGCGTDMRVIESQCRNPKVYDSNRPILIHRAQRNVHAKLNDFEVKLNYQLALPVTVQTNRSPIMILLKFRLVQLNPITMINKLAATVFHLSSRLI